MATQLKVMALASYPVEAAATRFRVEQFVTPLASRGIAMTVHPFFDAQTFGQLYQRKSLPKNLLRLMKFSGRRFGDLARARKADVIFVQREAMMFGPPLFEWLSTHVSKLPMVLDLDDATYVAYRSPTYGSLSRTLKWFGKTDDLIKWASIVTCGNSSIAEYVSSKGGEARIIPTVVDEQIFRPAQRNSSDDTIVLGWIGTHSTFPYLQAIFPALTNLAQRHRFRLKVVGAGRDEIDLPGVDIENLSWKLAREVADFQSLDIGLYPIDKTLYLGWASGKSGFKAIQYMAVGVPFVSSPVGGSKEIGESGITHFYAETTEQWEEVLEKLVSNSDLRKRMGAAGREHVIQNYGLSDQADKLADALRAAAVSSKW